MRDQAARLLIQSGAGDRAVAVVAEAVRVPRQMPDLYAWAVGKAIEGEDSPLVDPFRTFQRKEILGRILDQPMDSLPLTLWKYASQPYPERVAQAWGVALVLMIFVLLLNIIARVWIENRARRLRG